jgi:hypothetical protein
MIDTVHGTVAVSVAWARRGSTRQTRPLARHRTHLSLRHVYMASGPRMTVARRCLSVTIDASDAYSASAVNSNGRDTWRTVRVSDAEAASIAKVTDASIAFARSNRRWTTRLSVERQTHLSRVSAPLLAPNGSI